MSCASGSQSRTRSIITDNAHGGVGCPHDFQYQSCGTQKCPIEEIMASIPMHARPLMNCRNCRVYVCNPDDRAMYLVTRNAAAEVPATDSAADAVDTADASGGAPASDRDSFRAQGLAAVEWGVGIAGQIAQTGKFVNSIRPSEHPSYDARVDRGVANDLEGSLRGVGEARGHLQQAAHARATPQHPRDDAAARTMTQQHAR